MSAYSQPIASAAEPFVHIRTSFEVLVQASYAETAPLFGPIGERSWVGEHWNPEFVHPQPGRDEEGAVFNIRRGESTEVWVNTLFDAAARHFQYVYFIPQMAVTTIDLRFKPLSAGSTQVNVDFTRTALTAKGNERVIAMSEGDKKADKKWGQAIDALLASRMIGLKP